MSNRRSVLDNSMSGLRLKAAISVSEMARTLHMSRARFYELVKAGVNTRRHYQVTRRRDCGSQVQRATMVGVEVVRFEDS